MTEKTNQHWMQEDLEKLSQIINPVTEKTKKLKEGENRIVSVFFLDIHGFTALSEKLRSESVHEMMDKVLEVFSNSVLKYGGYIDKYEGDLIMALLGV